MDRYARALRKNFDTVYDSSEYKDRHRLMDRWLKEYTGHWWPDGMDDNKSNIHANFIFSTIQSTAPLLTDNKPIWTVRARDAKLQGVVEMYNKAGEYLWDKLDMDSKLFQAVKDCLLWPVGLLKVYFDAEEDELAIGVEDPRNFAISTGYDDLWEAAWCGVKVKKPLTWIKRNYPDKFDEVKSDDNPDSDNTQKLDPELEGEMATVYEIWVRDNETEEYIIKKEKESNGIVIDEEKKGTRKKYPNGRIIIMTKDLVLEDKPSPFAHGKPPWVVFYDYRINHSFWGMGEPMQIEELNREFNLRLQTMVSQAHRTELPNYTSVSGSGIDPDKVKSQIAEGGNVWVVNPGYENPLTPVLEPPLNRVHMDLMQFLPTLVEEISGVTDISKGQAAKKQRQSASEVSILIESSYTRTRQRVRNLEWSISRLWYMMVDLMQQFYDTPRSVSFKDEGETAWMNVGNSPQMAAQASKPMQMPGEPKETYDERLAGPQGQDFRDILDEFGPEDKVYAAFDIEIQTNSTLPMDKQSQANLLLKLIETRVQPDSVIDAKTALDHVLPGQADQIMERKRKEMEQAQAMAAQQGGGQ